MLNQLLRRAVVPSLIVLTSFLVTFAIIRAITFLIRVGIGPFHNVTAGGVHIHHMFWGILILLAVGYLVLVPLGSLQTPIPRWISCVTAGVYGIGSALTLDEFALWLHFRDVYWESQGFASIDAAAVFVAMVAISIWGGPILAARASELVRAARAKVQLRLVRSAS